MEAYRCGSNQGPTSSRTVWQVGQRQFAAGEPLDCRQDVGVDAVRAHWSSRVVGSAQECELGERVPTLNAKVARVQVRQERAGA